MSFSAPPGVYDIIPFNDKEIWKSSYLWNFLENHIRQISKQYGFLEIRTPILEKTDLFTRCIGESSDIVTKEMYTFKDKGDRLLTMRPEGTAPAIRAFIENQLSQKIAQQKIFYIAPMFRYERAQAGRYRQHHQFGVEAIGSETPEVDAEVIDLAFSLLKRLGVKNLTVSLNSIGNKESREKYKIELKKYLVTQIEKLSNESQSRFEKNPLRILDSKSPEDQEIIAKAPKILDYLDQESLSHFEKLQHFLKLLNIPFQINPLLVRGLDYYNKTVFEITSTNLGAQNSIVGGGRYDGLIKELGGPELPSAGFGMGLERLLQTMIAQNVSLPEPTSPTLFIIPLGEQAKEICLKIQKELRDSHIAVQMASVEKKLNKMMSYANEIRAAYVAIIGENEINEKSAQLKHMATGTTVKVPFSSLKRILQVEVQTTPFLNLWQEMAKPFDQKVEADFFLKKIDQIINETDEASQHLQKALKQIKTVLDV